MEFIDIYKYLNESVTDPFKGIDLTINNKLTSEDLIRAIRMDI